MKIGTEDKKKLITAGVLGFCAIFALGYLYVLFFGGSSTPPPPPAAVAVSRPTGSSAMVPAGAVGLAAGSVASARTSGGASAVKVATVNGQLDPTLHMEGMLAAESLVYSGTGRNIFGVGPAQSPIPVVKPIAPARPGPVVPQQIIAQGPPPPPPINLRFFGVATQDGKRRALLISGDDVFLAYAGDIVQRRYKIVTIAANSITVEDMPNSNKQTLPLVAN